MHPKSCLICSVYPPTGRLEDWNWREGSLSAGGNIYGDTQKRWRDGTYITTSQIVNIDPESGHLRTRNSNYVLGKRWVDIGSNKIYCHKCQRDYIGEDDLSQASKLCDKCTLNNLQKLQDAGAFTLPEK